MQSQCRITIRKCLGLKNLDKVDKLGLVSPFNDFVAFREIFISPPMFHDESEVDVLTQSIARANKVLKVIIQLNDRDV